MAGGVSTCDWKEEYACYKSATCVRQGDGACGWAASPSLDACLAGGGTGAPGQFCGGIGAIQCPAGQTCKAEGTYPDAGGTCVLPGETLGKTCGAIRGTGIITCNDGEFCSYTLSNICGRADATFAAKPTSWPLGCAAPACQPRGCDGVSYCNECEANKAGTSVVACHSAGQDGPRAHELADRRDLASFAVIAATRFSQEDRFGQACLTGRCRAVRSGRVTRRGRRRAPGRKRAQWWRSSRKSSAAISATPGWLCPRFRTQRGSACRHRFRRRPLSVRHFRRRCWLARPPRTHRWALRRWTTRCFGGRRSQRGRRRARG